MTQSGNQSIHSVLKETRTFAPPATFSASAHISSEQQYEAMWHRAKDDPAGFWGEMAGNLDWFRKWDTVMQGHMPDTQWFVGGKINACYNCVDRHHATKRQSYGKANRATLAYFAIRIFIAKFASLPTC